MSEQYEPPPGVVISPSEDRAIKRRVAKHRKPPKLQSEEDIEASLYLMESVIGSDETCIRLLMHDLVSHIDSLREENRELLDGLRPFAKDFHEFKGEPGFSLVGYYNDLRRAARLLAKHEPKAGG